MKLITVEYSPKQKCYHVDNLPKVLKQNFNDSLRDPNDNNWILIGLVETFKQAEKIVQYHQKVVKFEKGDLNGKSMA